MDGRDVRLIHGSIDRQVMQKREANLALFSLLG